jgi:tripartite-type tricarboxylate transporter receptor subunit TctC
MRRWLHIPVTVALLLVCTLARAEYPDHTVQVLVPFPAGGVVDVVGRRFSDMMADILKQPMVILNRDGASGIIAMQALANAPSDGYTLAFAPNGPLTIQPSLRKVPYAVDSFRPICQVSVVTYVLVVSPNSPVQNLRDFVARAKSEGELKAAIGGVGTVPHFVLLGLAQAAHTRFLIVPYRGDPGVTVAIKSGDVEGGVLGVDTAIAQGFRILAVFAPQRLAFLPDTPTAAEQGMAVQGNSTTGLFAPRGVSKAIADKLESACKTVTADPRFANALLQFKQEAAYLPSADFGAALQRDADEKRKLIEASGIKQEK